MAHAIACYDRETGKLECCCEQMDAPELLRDHGHSAFKIPYQAPVIVMYACDCCGADVTYPNQWCPRCLRESVE